MVEDKTPPRGNPSIRSTVEQRLDNSIQLIHLFTVVSTAISSALNIDYLGMLLKALSMSRKAAMVTSPVRQIFLLRMKIDQLYQYF